MKRALSNPVASSPLSPKDANAIPAPPPSFYVNDAFYTDIVTDARRFGHGKGPGDPELARRCEAFLFWEAWLLDAGRLEEWLGLFTESCLYWVPIQPIHKDPRDCVSVSFDDRRRLEDRIVWLRTGYVHSQTPPARTVRMISNVQAWKTDDERVWTKSYFMLHAFRHGSVRMIAGTYDHVLLPTGDPFRFLIQQKICSLIESEGAIHNLTLIL